MINETTATRGNCVNECRYCGKRTSVNLIGYCDECSKPKHPGLIKGVRFSHGIWNRKHNIASRDIATPEVHPSRKSAEGSLKFRMQNYASMGYEIWWHKIDEIDVYTCNQCGRLAEKDRSCLYCGSEPFKF